MRVRGAAPPITLASPMPALLVVVVLACTESSGTRAPAVPLTITADPDNVTRATARWEPAAPVEVWLSHGDGVRTPITTGTEMRLLGLPAGVETTVRLESADGVLGETTFAAGALPTDLAVPELVGEPSTEEGWVAVASFGFGGPVPSVVLLDSQARTVGYWRFDDLGDVLQGHPTVYSLRHTPGVLWAMVGEAERQRIARLPIDGSEVSYLDAPGAHHDFVVRPDGSVAWLRSVTRSTDAGPVTGDEILVHAPDGTERVAWSAFDTLPIERHYGWDAFPGIPGDWTHANGLDWDPQAGRWTVSLYWLRALVVVDDASGEVVQTLVGRDTPAGFGPQHSPIWVGDGWWLYDNNDAGEGSRALHLSSQGEVLGEWLHGEFSGAMGDVSLTDDGGLLVTAGVLPGLWRLDAELQPIWDVRWPIGHTVGQAEALADLYEGRVPSDVD